MWLKTPAPSATATSSAPRAPSAAVTAPAVPDAEKPAEPEAAVARTPAPPASGPVVAHIESGQAIVNRAGSRYLLKTGAQLPAGDPALDALRRGVLLETGIPGALTDRVVSALAGVDHLGTLLKVDAAVEEAIRSTELTFEKAHGQGNIFTGFPAQQVTLSIGEAKATVLDKLDDAICL